MYVPKVQTGEKRMNLECKFCHRTVTKDDFWKYVDGGSYVCRDCARDEWAKQEHAFAKEWQQ